MRAVGDDIVVVGAANILLADVVSGGIGEAVDHWGAEDAAIAEEGEHPSATEEIGHDLFDVGDAIGFGELGFLLGLADVLTIGVVEGHHCHATPMRPM